MNPRKWLSILALAAAPLLLAFAALPQKDAWKPLFNGKDLTGWKHIGPGNMTVEDGLIRTHGGMGLLFWTGGKLSGCRIRVAYKLPGFTSISVDINLRPLLPIHVMMHPTSLHH